MMLLEMARDNHGDRVAVSAPGQRSLTYAELFERAGRGAAHLRAAGAQHVVYLGTNSTAFATAVFAAAWAGAPILPLNYRLGAEQISALLSRHANTVLLVEQPLRHLASEALATLGTHEWLELTTQGVSGEEWSSDENDVAVLLYTSGTTSAPKAAILRQRHLLSYVFGSVDFASAAGGDAALVTVPPYHIAGVANLITNLYAGRRLVYLDRFTPELWLDTVRREAVTSAMVVPTMLARIVSALDGQVSAQVPTLQSLAYGGSRIAPTTVARALELFPDTDFVNAYGLTETSSTIAVLGPDDHRAAAASKDPDVRARLGSIGRLLPGVEGQIRDIDGNHVDVGQTGELWIRGDQVSGEYLAGSSQLDPDGWFPTRDRAHADAEGYLFIEGRADDLIIRGGENTSPAEIEEVLIQHPSVGEVAVVGIPDEEWGQRIAAVVVPAEGAAVDSEVLKEFARDRLCSSKTPDVFEFWAELPYTDTGKLLRRVVLRQLEAGQIA